MAALAAYMTAAFLLAESIIPGMPDYREGKLIRLIRTPSTVVRSYDMNGDWIEDIRVIQRYPSGNGAKEGEILEIWWDRDDNQIFTPDEIFNFREALA